MKHSHAKWGKYIPNMATFISIKHISSAGIHMKLRPDIGINSIRQVKEIILINKNVVWQGKSSEQGDSSNC